MSNGLAIAAVTASLRRSADGRAGDPDVTARPLDKARATGIAGDQLNLFLYHTQVERRLAEHRHAAAGPNRGRRAIRRCRSTSSI